MCGRFTLALNKKDSLQGFAVDFGLSEVPDLPSRYNIAPSQAIAVVIEESEKPRKLQWMQWGLIPSWAKDPSITSKLINARAETLSEKPSFRAAFKRRRCLIPADGFFEWQKVDGKKQPHYICLEERQPFAFAGLWEHWQSGDGSEILTSTIITTTASALMKPIHDRMPVILEPADYDQWLDPYSGDPTRLLLLLKPYEGENLRSFPVSTKVNKPQNDDPECIEPISVERVG
jgi:putative SOS response-associated peptidase YedK